MGPVAAPPEELHTTRQLSHWTHTPSLTPSVGTHGWMCVPSVDSLRADRQSTPTPESALRTCTSLQAGGTAGYFTKRQWMFQLTPPLKDQLKSHYKVIRDMVPVGLTQPEHTNIHQTDCSPSQFRFLSDRRRCRDPGNSLVRGVGYPGNSLVRV